jgi:hypothetical protein
MACHVLLGLWFVPPSSRRASSYSEIIASFSPAKVKTFEFFEYDGDGKLILVMYRVSAGKIFP